jgi:tRNA threonylcarbamoyladenosine biosynthesis protein TsaB
MVSTEFNCIAIETSTERGSVAVCKGKLLFEISLDDDRANSRQIFGQIKALLERADLEMSALDCIAYGCGPGSFTGVRVAASAAQGLAYARRLPVVSVSSLAALAHAAGDGAGILAASLDARMGEAYVGVYERDAAGAISATVADALVVPDNYRLVQICSDARPVGPGWAAYPQMLEGHTGMQETDVWPEAAAVVEIARGKFAVGDVNDAAAALPNYIRDRVTG